MGKVRAVLLTASLGVALESSLGILPVGAEPSGAVEPMSDSTDFIREPSACPRDFDTLAPQLIRDLPAYTNRILQSSVADLDRAYRPAYVITASQPEQAPLDITDRVYTTQAQGEQTHQLFFTTLERQYSGLVAQEINHFHWLFLVPSDGTLDEPWGGGWQLVFMFSAIDGAGAVQMPPRDSSYGSIAQGIQRWLTDCRAGAVVLE